MRCEPHYLHPLLIDQDQGNNQKAPSVAVSLDVKSECAFYLVVHTIRGIYDS